ncbi:MAG TPA: glycosyltransferase family 2 protein, partial [Gemmatimonadales bacterium]|nr:glycosyltransferase family 2 protein [Gemmatimonadales bacterium]
MSPLPVVDVSLLVPAKDEAENLPEFLRLCQESLGKQPFSFEVVVVNDGSRDATGKVLSELASKYSFLRVVTHRRQRGIADALRSAGDVAQGDVFVFYPADLQYLPEDVPALVNPILQDEADIVTGTKQGKYDKAFVSGVYNRLCRFLFGVDATDLNSVK